MTTTPQDPKTSLQGSTQVHETPGEHLHPATGQHMERHVAQAGKAARGGAPGRRPTRWMSDLSWFILHEQTFI